MRRKKYKLMKLEVEVLTTASLRHVEKTVLDALSANPDHSNIRAEVVSSIAYQNGKEVENG